MPPTPITGWQQTNGVPQAASKPPERLPREFSAAASGLQTASIIRHRRQHCRRAKSGLASRKILSSQAGEADAEQKQALGFDWYLGNFEWKVVANGGSEVAAEKEKVRCWATRRHSSRVAWKTHTRPPSMVRLRQRLPLHSSATGSKTH